jgi:hypothetical protein
MMHRDPKGLLRSLHRGVEPLFAAISSRQQDVLKLLLQFDSNLAREPNDHDDTYPLILAAYHNNMEAFDILINCLGPAVADQLDALDWQKCTAMDYSVSNGNTVMIERLVSLGSTAHMFGLSGFRSVMH